MSSPLIRQAILEAREAQRSLTGDELRKAFTVASGLNVQNFEEGLKHLELVRQPYFRNRVFRNPNLQGNAIAFKRQTALNTANLLGYVPEGVRGVAQGQTTGDITRAVATWGIEDSYTREAVQQGAGYDPEAVCIENLLQSYSDVEERILFQANHSLLLGLTPQPTGAAVVGGGALVANNYYAVCFALTLEGWWLFRNTTLAAGLALAQACTSPAGEAYTINTGLAQVSIPSAAVAIAGPADRCDWTVTAVQGAVAYAWFFASAVGVYPGDAACFFGGISTTNVIRQAAIGAAPAQTLAALAPGAADRSTVATAPDGIFSQAVAPVNVVTNPVPGYWVSNNNAALTMVNGLITEVDNALLWFSQNRGMEPEDILVSPGMLHDITSLAYSAANPRVMFTFGAPEVSASGITLGGTVNGIINPYTGNRVGLRAYDYIPDGTMFFARNAIPIKGVASNRNVELAMYGGVYRIDWSPTTRTNFHGMYAAGGIKMYAPQYMGAVVNIARTP